MERLSKEEGLSNYNIQGTVSSVMVSQQLTFVIDDRGKSCLLFLSTQAIVTQFANEESNDCTFRENVT